MPIINVGNLSVGGTGKTPHIEYLIKLLSPFILVGTVSRGYKRKTRGFRMVETLSTVDQVGDEALQIKLKHPGIPVSVGEERALAVPKLLTAQPAIRTVLLDDAFQHLGIKAGLNILLTKYNQPYFNDYLLPAGRLREWRSAYKRADIIVVTKCPEDLEASEKEAWSKQIGLQENQRLYFSHYKYGNPYFMFNAGQQLELNEATDVLVFCAIAETKYLESYLIDHTQSTRTLSYEDHHQFTKLDIGQMKREYEQIDSKRKVIITTEKDAVRLNEHRNFLIEEKLPVFILPIEVEFNFNEEAFGEDIIDYLKNFKV